MNRTKIYIILAIVAIVLALTAAFYEWKQIPDVVWKNNYNYNSESPYGLFVFKNIVEDYYDLEGTVVNEMPSDSVENSLIISFVSSFSSSAAIDSFLTMSQNGNDILLISEQIHWYLFDSLGFDGYQDERFDDTIALKFQDSIHFEYFSTNRYFEPAKTYKSYGYSYQEGGFKDVVLVDDSLTVCVDIPVSENLFTYHFLDELFFNQAYRQPSMFDYTQKLLSRYSPESLIFISNYHPSNYAKNKNPLQFIMSSPPLKAAYFLFVLGLILYAILGGKRKQKIIPIEVKNRNTSLEYIDTVSQLFYQQNKPEKLVKHMKDIFFHRMQKKFFVSPQDSDYLEILSRKSKLPKGELKYILDRFDNLENNFHFTDTQLMNLNRRLDFVYDFIDSKEIMPTNKQ